MTQIENIQTILDAKTRRWWFFILLFLIQFFIPPYVSKNFSMMEWGAIIGYTLGHSLYGSIRPVFPVFQLVALAMVVVFVLFKNRARTAISLYAGISFLLFAVLQNVAVGERYGLSIVTINVFMFILVAGAWFWEAAVRANDFSKPGNSLWQYLTVPLAILAFWCPLRLPGGQPDFNPLLFLTSGSSLTFCMMTPVFLALLLFYYPRVNMVTLRVTSAVGVIIGIYNVLPKLVFGVYGSRWDGVLHLPLLILSFIGVVLSLLRPRNNIGGISEQETQVAS